MTRTIRFFRVATDYWARAALARAGEPAEVLYLRAQAYAAGEETGDVLPKEALPLLGLTRTTARINALVREDLFEKVPQGWRIHGGLEQETSDSIERRREQGRIRQQRRRARGAGQPAPPDVTEAVTKGASHGERHALHHASPLSDEEVDAACGSSAGERRPLPESVEILRGRLEASGLVVRWDTLNDPQISQVVEAQARYGDDALIAAARGQHRPDDPARFASAWIRLWTNYMPEPGRHLGLVRHPPCPKHGTQVSPSGVCSSCAADEKAGHP